MYLKPDGWRLGENIKKDSGYKDSIFPGCEYRLSVMNGRYNLAINLKETGKTKWNDGKEWHRVIIEFVGDGEPSTFCRGWIVDNGVSL